MSVAPPPAYQTWPPQPYPPAPQPPRRRWPAVAATAAGAAIVALPIMVLGVTLQWAFPANAILAWSIAAGALFVFGCTQSAFVAQPERSWQKPSPLQSCDGGHASSVRQ